MVAPTNPPQPSAVTHGTNDITNNNPISGFLALLILFGWAVFCVYNFVHMDTSNGPLGALFPVLGIGVLLFCLKGLLILDPNMAVVCTFFGQYAATIRTSGFFWINPFYATTKISLRVENFNSATLKVNDKLGNPIEIAAVITWRVRSPARAVFDVEGYMRYIQIQSEMSVRDVASNHVYDSTNTDEVTLRGNSQGISDLLKTTVQDHVQVAGIEILGAKLMHLAYASEIAGVMLRRQQAGAVIQARELMVEGAVGMIQIALARLEKENIATLTPPERATLITNMMTVLLSEANAQPVIQLSTAQD